MRMLVDRSPNAEAWPFELDALKAHARVSDDSEDAVLMTMGAAATAEVEHTAQIALLMQTISVVIFDPEPGSFLSLPIGPVADVPTVTIDGEAFTDFEFVAGLRPMIRWGSDYACLSPERMDIEYQAGFGASAIDVPMDLRQALLDQAALLYDGRSPMDTRSLASSPHMARIAARYRGVQV